MGAWGTSLYANDAASDIRGDYVDKLRRGKTNEEATQEMINDNQEVMGDAEEEPLFWFALADTQWDYGRLLPDVKEKALFYLSQDKEMQRKPLDYEIKLICESEKTIPKDNLTFVGNLQGEDLIPFRGHDYWTGYGGVGWESSKYNIRFEHYVIDMYAAWTGG